MENEQARLYDSLVHDALARGDRATARRLQAERLQLRPDGTHEPPLARDRHGRRGLYRPDPPEVADQLRQLEGEWRALLDRIEALPLPRRRQEFLDAYQHPPRPPVPPERAPARPTPTAVPEPSSQPAKPQVDWGKRDV